jgi:predicted DNA-binding protein (MmcQ/YjbR family)
MDIEWLQKTCLSWPATEEEVKWENALCFMVARKIFCLISLDEDRISFKVPDELFEELSGTDGFIPAPYLARAKWVTLVQMEKISKKELAAYLQQSYDLIRAKLPKKVKAEFGL